MSNFDDFKISDNSDSDLSDLDGDSDDALLLQIQIQRLEDAGIEVPKELSEQLKALSIEEGKNNGLQKTLIQEGMFRKENSVNLLEKILEEVGNYLKSNPNTPYKVIGGKAVSNWLNPEHKKLKKEELEHIKTIDWDLAVMGHNKMSRKLTIDIHKHLEQKFNTTLEIRKDDTMTINSNSNIYVYQVGIPDNKKIEWIVDIHAENEKEFDMNNTVIFNNIRYPNLKNLIKGIQEAIEENPFKLVKRFTRKNLLEQAMKDIFRFNTYVSKEICKQCINNNYETLTGYNLNCYKIIRLCPQFKFEKQIKDRQYAIRLEGMRKRRLEELKKEDNIK